MIASTANITDTFAQDANCPPTPMRYCTRCVLPDTRPGIALDDEGVCTGCRNAEAKRNDIDWTARRRELDAIVASLRDRPRGYDCIIPVSGGKDSTWQVAKCLEFGLRILAVTWRTPGRTQLGQQNLDNLIRLGVDHIDYTINPEVERRFTYKTLARTGSSGVPMHMALYSIPLRLAVRMRIPLVVWGEDPHLEYGRTDDTASEQLDPDWGRRHGILQNTTAADWIDDDLSAKDLEPYFPPTADEFAAAQVRSIFLGRYLPWDPQETLRVAKANGFQTRAEGPRLGLYNYADIDCEFISVHHHFKWLKFGFTRLFDNLALEIRNGRMTRDQALDEIHRRGDQTPHADIGALCGFLRITRTHFTEIEERARNHDIWRYEAGVWKLPGFLIDDWNWS